MTVVVTQKMAEGFPPELNDELAAEMKVESEPPVGMYIHVDFLDDDGILTNLDIWDSVENYHTFMEKRLWPAAEKVAARHGIKVEGSAAEPVIVEARMTVAGRG